MPFFQHPASEAGNAVWYLEEIGNTITLQAGTYRVGGHIGNGDAVAKSNHKLGNGVSISNGYVRTNFPGGFNYPNLTFSSNGIRTTIANTNAIPEPSSAAVCGLIGLACFIRRKRKVR